ncbi:MAG: site-2 protease family protein [Sarcina sp.]
MGRSIFEIFLSIPAILIAFTAKEYIRARVAYNLGDKAQKLQGRMTLDPFAHIDIIGFILIALVGFGWSKPAEVNRYAFKKPKEDMIKVTLAAFSSYLLVAFVASILNYIVLFTGFAHNEFGTILALVLQYTAMINISLFVFNFIPMPGLEMHTLLVELAPGTAYKISMFTAQYQLPILIAIVVLARYVLAIPVALVSALISKLALLLVGIFF